MAAYFEFLQQWSLHQPSYYFVPFFCAAFILWAVLAFSFAKTTHLFLAIPQSFLATFLTMLHVVFLPPSVSYFVPKPYDTYALLSVAALYVIVLGTLAYRDRQRIKRSSNFAWAIPSPSAPQSSSVYPQPVPATLVQSSQHSDQPLRASHSSEMRTSAEQDMRAAFSHIEDAERPFFEKRNKLTLDDTALLFSMLDKAAQFVASARQKNPDQKLIIEDAKMGPITFMLDELAGAILYREGHVAVAACHLAFNDDNKNNALTRARNAFQRATKFCPDNGSYFFNLANVCLIQGDKPAASENITLALKLNPIDAESIKLQNEIAQLPDKSASKPFTKKKSTWVLKSVLSGVGCFIFVIVTMPREPPFRGPIPEWVLALLVFAGLVLIFGPLVLKFFAWKDYNEYRTTRVKQDLEAMKREIYEEQYRAETEGRRD